MERDCLIVHGVAANLHECLFTISDSSQMHICGKCNNMTNVMQRSVQGGKARGPYCRFCESVENIVKVNVYMVQSYYAMSSSACAYLLSLTLRFASV
ncbi:dna-directed rna polymerase d subunit 2b [Nicotiana attenuata]|uniref:Dna-directed rna polymerase d subunit 2b n=1 Tax=Nicotiana attenuata TaxID=49451 RepID=A0A1J6I716_NICAT|nr:dna-directed rna polymerase d subunit 2b [Nicotiana attenuata]OIT18780.1 dna-directed rna polymerase d subunit 2b [Nicotiana attenuata]